MDIKKFLSRTEFFKGISEKNIDTLAEICIPKWVKKKEILFLEGQEGQTIYLLACGSIRIFKSAPDGREMVIKVIKEGEIFGEVIQFEKTVYPASAIALEKSLVFIIPKLQINCLLANESFRNDFISMLMKKQRYLTERIFYLAAHDVEERFFHFLREQYGEKDEYSITLSKKDIASALGTIPETLSRLIFRLKKQGIISWEGNLLRIRRGFWKERD